jgi:hypothetical protein
LFRIAGSAADMVEEIVVPTQATQTGGHGNPEYTEELFKSQHGQQITVVSACVVAVMNE